MKLTDKFVEVEARLDAIDTKEFDMLVAAMRELLAYAKNGEHTEDCAWVVTYDDKSLECDCWRSVIPKVIMRRLGQ